MLAALFHLLRRFVDDVRTGDSFAVTVLQGLITGVLIVAVAVGLILIGACTPTSPQASPPCGIPRDSTVLGGALMDSLGAIDTTRGRCP